jgi:hypothetical protein
MNMASEVCYREAHSSPTARHHDADDRNGHSDQHHRQRQSYSSYRVVPLDQNLERPKPDVKETAPARGAS